MTDRTVSSILLAVVISISVSGCYTWQRIPLTREALEQEELRYSKVRITTGDTRRVVYLDGVHFPDPSGGLRGAYVTGTEGDTAVAVPLKDMADFEIAELSGKKTVEAGGRVVILCIRLVVGALGCSYGVPLGP